MWNQRPVGRRQQCEDGGRWESCHQSQGTCGAARNWERQQGSSPRGCGHARPHHLDLRPPISRTVGPGNSDGRESACRAGVLGSIPGLGGSPGEGYGYPRQYSCLKKSTGRGAWRATDNGVAKNRTRLSDFHSLIHSRAVREHVLSLQANQPGTLLCSSRELTHRPHY